MEVLSRTLKKTEEGGFIQGFHVGPINSTGVHVSHLLLANDTILFCDASREQMLSIRLVLTCFQAFIGLKVNVEKSEIVPIGQVQNIQSLANILQGKVGSLPMIYSGVPLGTLYKIASIWNPILERMEKKLSEWKRLYLSKGGRLTLLKSTFSSLLTYYLSLFTIPKAVATRLERIQRNFLWGSIVSASNFHWWLGKRFACYMSWVVWEFKSWCLLIRPYLANGSRGLAMKPLICGEGS